VTSFAGVHDDLGASGHAAQCSKNSATGEGGSTLLWGLKLGRVWNRISA
jgi:hypothetical protein